MPSAPDSRLSLILPPPLALAWIASLPLLLLALGLTAWLGGAADRDFRAKLRHLGGIMAERHPIQPLLRQPGAADRQILQAEPRIAYAALYAGEALAGQYWPPGSSEPPAPVLSFSAEFQPAQAWLCRRQPLQAGATLYLCGLPPPRGGILGAVALLLAWLASMLAAWRQSRRGGFDRLPLRLFYRAGHARLSEDAQEQTLLRRGEPVLNLLQPASGDKASSRWIRLDKLPCLDQAGQVQGVLLLEIDLKDRAEDAVEEVPPPPQPVQPLPQALPEPLASASPAAPARRFQALIVDDNEANCVIAQRMLARRGCDGDIVYSGMDAIARLQERSYDLILMDIQMPRMDGYETTRRIRAGAGNAPAIPIIAVTASATVDDVDRCMRAGMNAHIAKPVQLRRLSELLQQFLGTHETEHTEIGPLEMEKQNDTAPELPVFDPARLQQIAIGDSLLLARLTGGFVADVPAKVNSLAAMIERGDLSGAERAAHYVKGAARNIGASRLGQAAADAESAAKSCSIIELQQAAQQTRLELTRLIEEWQDIDWSKLA